MGCLKTSALVHPSSNRALLESTYESHDVGTADITRSVALGGDVRAEFQSRQYVIPSLDLVCFVSLHQYNV